ncbi:MAG: deoxyribodipyrimidine photo-lyase [Gammaproteobacteria bacterium]|nr:deoxyribodipyrimidine photo-lyase [Gammaproteobacteria bacterium]
MSVVIVWLRNDLRLQDNPALYHAAQGGAALLPVYLHSTDDMVWPLGGASRWWLHHSLKALDDSLRERGTRLHLYQGPVAQTLHELIDASGAQAVYANRRYEPELEAMDQAILQGLQEKGIPLYLYQSNLLNPPEALLNQQGHPYKVFTPYYKASLARGLDSQCLPAPDRIVATQGPSPGVELESLGLLPKQGWDAGFYEHWQPGEEGAHARLETFIDEGLKSYPDQRDLPAIDGTSRLSPHLHFGEISPRCIVARLSKLRHPAREAFIRQLVWRDFSHAVLHHFPQTSERAFNSKFDRFPWNKRHTKQLTAWQQGQTGIPIIDAGMRELWHTGTMHNRVRMLVGSFLTKNLLLHWQHGARWFWDTLVDADLAQNSMNWQWVAGCGVDAAPYFRIFNPVTQGEKFDTRGDYVRRWVPELAKLDNKWLHKPWEADRETLANAGIRLGRDYPVAIVDLKRSRQEALDAFKRIK